MDEHQLNSLLKLSQSTAFKQMEEAARAAYERAKPFHDALAGNQELIKRLTEHESAAKLARIEHDRWIKQFAEIGKMSEAAAKSSNVLATYLAANEQNRAAKELASINKLSQALAESAKNINAVNFETATEEKIADQQVRYIGQINEAVIQAKQVYPEIQTIIGRQNSEDDKESQSVSEKDDLVSAFEDLQEQIFKLEEKIVTSVKSGLHEANEEEKIAMETMARVTESMALEKTIFQKVKEMPFVVFTVGNVSGWVITKILDKLWN